MKSCKNRFFMLLVLAVSIFNTKLTQTEPEEFTTLSDLGKETEEPSKIAQSESFLKRLRESEFNRKLNERFDKVVNRFKKPQSESELHKPLLTDTPTQLEFKPAQDFGVNPAEVTVGAPDELPGEPDWSKRIYDPNDWIDVTTEEGKNLENSHNKALLDTQKAKLEAKNARLEALDEKVAAMTTPAEIQTLTPQEVQDLTIGIKELLKPELIKALTPEQIQNMTMDQILVLDKEQIQNFNFKDLTIQQIKRLVQDRPTGILQNLTDAQLSALSPEQMEAFLEARPGTFTEEQLDSLRQLLRLRGGSAVKIFLKDLTMKNFKNIFQSDSDLLEKYLQDPNAREQRLQEFAVSKALAKLSRTKIAELFTKITQNEIAKKRNDNPDLYTEPDKVEKLYIETFKENESLFKKLLEKTDPKSKRTEQYILIPSRPKEENSLVNFKFEILDMSSYDPNLTIAENAERMKKSQDLSIQADDVYSRAENKPSNTDLTSYIRNYLQDHPTKENLTALLVNDFTALNRTTSIKKAQEQLGEILNPKNKLLATNTEEAKIFRSLTANDLANITKAQIKAQERNMNLAVRGAKISYEEAKQIFKQNAKVYELFLNENTLLIPTELIPTDGVERNDQNRLKFDKVNLNGFTKELSQIKFQNVDLNLFDKTERESWNGNNGTFAHGLVNIRATEALQTVVQKIKADQPDIKLSDLELAEEIKDFVQKGKMKLPKRIDTPTEALTKIATEKFGSEEVNKRIMEIKNENKNSDNEEETTRKVNLMLQQWIHPRQ